ncbi:MAG: CHAT domain-containing protein, partial [Pseudomonadota bacterium]
MGILPISFNNTITDLPMFDNFDITILSTEPSVQGETNDKTNTATPNVIAHYSGGTNYSTFSVAAITDDLARLMAAFAAPEDADDIFAQINLQTIGADLFNAIFHGDLRDVYIGARTACELKGHCLRLHINSPDASVVALPWEYLYEQSRDRWLATDTHHAIIRSLPAQTAQPNNDVDAEAAIAVTDELRVLVMISNPADLMHSLDVDAEWQRLQAVEDVAMVRLIRVKPTYEALLEAVRRQQPHVFHFVGHGLFHDETNQGLLLLEDQQGNMQSLPAHQLATAIAQCQSLRLAFLNACQSSTATGSRVTAGATDAATAVQTTQNALFAGMAQKLIQQQFPAVIAMQAPIPDKDAILFAEEFYRALTDGYTLEQALIDGRKRLMETDSLGSGVWGIPTLYSQGTRSFQITPLADAQRIERLLMRVQVLVEGRDDTTTRRRKLIDQILAIDPNHIEARALQQRADDEAKVAGLYGRAEEAYQGQMWRQAYDLFAKIEQLVPNFRQTRQRLSHVLGALNDKPVVPEPKLEEEYQTIVRALLEGRLVPFLGSDVCRVGRPVQDGWVHHHHPPAVTEVAKELAGELPDDLRRTWGETNGNHSLLQVAQYTMLWHGERSLYRHLNRLYQGSYTPTVLHRLLAELPQCLAGKMDLEPDTPYRYVLFSTALDTLLEDAFLEANQPFHLFAYRPAFEDEDDDWHPECFLHFPPHGQGDDQHNRPQG